MIQRLAGLLALCLIALILVPAATPAFAAASSADLSIKDIEPMQVILDAPLVIGKPTVVRVNVGIAKVQGEGPIPATVTLSWGGKTIHQDVVLQANQQSQFVDFYPSPPDKLAPIQINALVDIANTLTDPDPSNNTLANPISVDVVQSKDDKIHLVFLPVDWTEQDFSDFTKATGLSFGDFMQKHIKDNIDFMSAVFPVLSSQIVYTYTLTPHNFTPQERAGVMVGGTSGFIPMLASIRYRGMLMDPNATITIAMMPPGWFSDLGRDWGGVTSIAYKGATLNETARSPDPVTDVIAHETGHQFDLYEDYEFNITNRVGYRLDTPGFWVAKKQPVPEAADLAGKTYSCEKTADYGSPSAGVLGIMAGGGADPQRNTANYINRWADTATYWWLLGKQAVQWTGQPSLSRAVTASELDPPRGDVSTGKYYICKTNFRQKDKIVYLSVAGRYLKQGQQVTAKWYNGDQLVQADDPVDIDTSSAFQYADFALYNEKGLKPGSYRVDVFLDGQKQISTTFTVK